MVNQLEPAAVVMKGLYPTIMLIMLQEVLAED